MPAERVWIGTIAGGRDEEPERQAAMREKTVRLREEIAGDTGSGAAGGGY